MAYLKLKQERLEDIQIHDENPDYVKITSLQIAIYVERKCLQEFINQLENCL